MGGRAAPGDRGGLRRTRGMYAWVEDMVKLERRRQPFRETHAVQCSPPPQSHHHSIVSGDAVFIHGLESSRPPWGGLELRITDLDLLPRLLFAMLLLSSCITGLFDHLQQDR
ncbi:hypothetical protein BHM03_00030672 [Ensete ventricosum]|nr:hypothetical protein BHM03_00030672 [Ensete ventricosum]